jgi:hypothetical protein
MGELAWELTGGLVYRWAFTEQHNVQLRDEYDQINHDMAPHWALFVGSVVRYPGHKLTFSPPLANRTTADTGTESCRSANTPSPSR